MTWVKSVGTAYEKVESNTCHNKDLKKVKGSTERTKKKSNKKKRTKSQAEPDKPLTKKYFEQKSSKLAIRSRRRSIC